MLLTADHEVLSSNPTAGEIQIMILRCFNAQPFTITLHCLCIFVCVEVLRPSQLNGVMLSAVSLPNHTFTGQA